MANTKRTTTKAARKTNPIAPKVTIPAEMNEADYSPAQRLLSHLQTIPADVLGAIARGEIDARALALDELANRGLCPLSGKWIGFPLAEAAAASVKTRTRILELPATKITREGLVLHLTTNPAGELVYVTVPE